MHGSDRRLMTADQLDVRAKGLALALLAVTQFVIILDASIVNVALPSIGRALDFSQDNLSWVVNAYTLAFGGFLLLGGRLADLMGRRRMFMSGLVLFTAASLLGGLAQSDVWLVAARAAQGLGAALALPPRCRSSPRSSTRAPSATGRSGSGAPWPAPVAPPGSSLAAC
jgi:MFS family permease